jgi:hypothetical protein
MYNSYDMFFKKINAGIAINYLHDDWMSSTYTTDLFNLTYAQYFYLLDKQLRIVPSVQAGGIIKKIGEKIKASPMKVMHR